MGATEGFLKGEVKVLVDKLRDKEEEIKKLKSDLSLVIKERDDNIKQNKKLSEENGQLEEDNINLISFNEHYSPEVIVKYEDRYETAYKEEGIENAKLCDKMRRLEEENKNLREENKRLSDFLECEA